jgi:hypothetical protein
MASLSAEILADSPVGFWKLNETGGTTAADSSGNGRDGTYNSVTLNQAGPTDLTDGALVAAGFGGSSSVSIPDNAAFDITGDFTVEALIYPTSFTGYPMIVTKTADGLNLPYEMRLENSTGKTAAYANNTSNPAATGAIATNATTLNGWQHVAIRKSGTTLANFLGGLLNGTTSNGIAGVANAHPLRIGQRGDGYGFTGRIAYVAIYNTALSDSRIAARTAALSGGALRVYQEAMEVGVGHTAPPMRVYQEAMEIGVSNSAPPMRVYQEALEVAVVVLPSTAYKIALNQ